MFESAGDATEFLDITRVNRHRIDICKLRGRFGSGFDMKTVATRCIIDSPEHDRNLLDLQNFVSKLRFYLIAQVLNGFPSMQKPRVPSRRRFKLRSAQFEAHVDELAMENNFSKRAYRVRRFSTIVGFDRFLIRIGELKLRQTNFA